MLANKCTNYFITKTNLHDEMKKVANVLVGVGAKFLNLRDAPAVGTN